MSAYVLLEDGTRFDGEACGADVYATGEVVFTTGMSGYQESMTDPSFAGQLITFTYPHIGNYGASAQAMESDRVWARAAIMRAAANGEDGFESRSENCCFAGRRLRGRVLMTLAGGAIAYRERALVAVAA